MTTLSQSTTNINITPIRIEADHYQIASFTDDGKVYDMHFNYDIKRWECNCPTHNCKHTALLRAYIKRAECQELINLLSRISILEKADEAEELARKIKQQQIERQQEQLDHQRELIGLLQSQVCKLNERTINQEGTIKHLLMNLDDRGNEMQRLILYIEDMKRKSAQENERLELITSNLGDKINAQKDIAPKDKPISAKRGRKTHPNKVVAIKESGLWTKCLVGGEFEVQIDNFSPISCSCSSFVEEGKYCVHMHRVDSEFSV